METRAASGGLSGGASLITAPCAATSSANLGNSADTCLVTRMPKGLTSSARVSRRDGSRRLRRPCRVARTGITIVSGLARGIDAAAHRGALAAGGRTLAVLGSGVLNMYPPEHAALADEVAAHGAVISEAPPRSPPLAGAFPQRNRIISGMSLGVLVVEASTSSGALISARHAMEQGREVFAVPGRVDNRMSHGCHRLIRDGAKLVETADDVLEELGPLVAPRTSASGEAVHHPAELLLNELEQQVLAADHQRADHDRRGGGRQRVADRRRCSRRSACWKCATWCAASAAI